jgi:DNA-binding SARP family transcriptional activator
LSALPDERPLMVVFDNVSWAGDPESLFTVERALAEAPVGSTAVVTTRAAVGSAGASRVWTVGTEQLMFTDLEISLAWKRFACRNLCDAMAGEVALASGRHAALVSLMARHAAFLGVDLTSVECTASISSLVTELAFGQLDDEDRGLLHYAAALGEAGIETLENCCGHKGVGEGMLRIAAVLPLVSVSPRQRFKVHDLVADALGSVSYLASRDPGGLRRVVDCLAAAGAAPKALEVAVGSGLEGLVAAALVRLGSHLLKGASWELVNAGLDVLPIELVAAEPGLLLVRAEADWVAHSQPGAIHQVELAMRLADLAGDMDTSSAARSLLAGMRMALADFSGAIADVSPLLETDRMPVSDQLADALYAAIPARGFMADCEGLGRLGESARQLILSGGASGSRLARLELILGVVADYVSGDSVAATALFAAAAAREDVPQPWRVTALSNLAVAALETGDLTLAEKCHNQAAVAPCASSGMLDRALLDVTKAALDGFNGQLDDLEPAIERVMALCGAASEGFTLAATGIAGAVYAVMIGNALYGLNVSQRGILCAAATGSPVLTWLAELVHAQASLALGDVEHARLTAERILPQVAPIGAMGHVLHARMILAQAALHEGDLAAAVQHLSAVSDHIVDKSPALTVASYLRAFPGMLGPLALAMGVDRIPVRVLNLVSGHFATEAIERAADVLTAEEVARLSRRMHAEAERAAAQEQVGSDEVCAVRLFGGLEVVTARGPVGDRDWTKRKARLLFAMLVSRCGTDVPRGEIIEYLWPEMDEERALNNFYVVWSAMKRALSPDSVRETPCPFVEHVHGVCRIRAGHVESDLDEFTELLGAARRARTTGDADAELVALRSVSDLYRGEVLPGDVYDDWFAPLRERFRHDFEDAMMRAAQLMEENSDPRGGLSLLRKAMAHDPWREDLYQASLRLQMAAGQRSAAIETYLSCRSRLVEDLGIDPSRETTALYEQVLGMEVRPNY